MFESIMKIVRKMTKKEDQTLKSKDTAKERLHLVLMQDRANVSADFLDLMKQEIIEVIKKYIDIDESAMDVRLTNKENGDGTNGAPALYANIPILNIKDEARKNAKVEQADSNKKENNTSEEHIQEKNNNVEEESHEEIKIEDSNDMINNEQNNNEKVEEKQEKTQIENKEYNYNQNYQNYQHKNKFSKGKKKKKNRRYY